MAEATGPQGSELFTTHAGTTPWDLTHGIRWAVIHTATMGLVTTHTVGTAAWVWADFHPITLVHMDGIMAGQTAIIPTDIIHSVMGTMHGTGSLILETRRHHLLTNPLEQALITAADVLTNTAEAQDKAALAAESTTTRTTGEIMNFKKQELPTFLLLAAGRSLSLKRHKNLCVILRPLALEATADQAKR